MRMKTNCYFEGKADDIISYDSKDPKQKQMYHKQSVKDDDDDITCKGLQGRLLSS